MDSNEQTPSPDAPVTQEPIWLTWHESEVADLTDDEVWEFIKYWRGQADEFRAKRAAVDIDHPDARRWGFSGWNCGKQESKGGREIERRRIQREKGIQP